MEKINYKLEIFEGPMDLLLHLISKHKLNINDIPIIELVNQYVDYVRQMENADFEIAGDFLEMAARLIYIKTASLLPRHEEAEKLKKELTGELIEYRDCKIIAKRLSENTAGFDRYVRQPAGSFVNYDYERFHEADTLLDAYINSAGRAQRKLPPPISSFKDIVRKKFVDVSEKVNSVISAVKGRKKVGFASLIKNAKSKSEIVATFLAVLQLAKARKIVIGGTADNAEIEMTEEVNDIEE
ncbi:MAG: segregation/condensation protein A [Clostridiales bacterium]|nr:segregation/condensation protein A [Clostridiales bacterium]